MPESENEPGTSGDGGEDGTNSVVTPPGPISNPPGSNPQGPTPPPPPPPPTDAEGS